MILIDSLDTPDCWQHLLLDRWW